LAGYPLGAPGERQHDERGNPITGILSWILPSVRRTRYLVAVTGSIRCSYGVPGNMT
jgi:hypothetical protein